MNRNKAVMLSKIDKKFRFIEGNKGSDECSKDVDDLDELSDATGNVDVKMKKKCIKEKNRIQQRFWNSNHIDKHNS